MFGQINAIKFVLLAHVDAALQKQRIMFYKPSVDQFRVPNYMATTTTTIWYTRGVKLFTSAAVITLYVLHG